MNHKKRHNEKGSGFGCAVVNLDGVSNTLVSGNMGRERNLIKDSPCKKNRWGIRRLTERECARLQGFPDSFKIPVSMTQAYKQFGNAVSVPVIRTIAEELEKYLTANVIDKSFSLNLYKSGRIKGVEIETVTSL